MEAEIVDPHVLITTKDQRDRDSLPVLERDAGEQEPARRRRDIDGKRWRPWSSTSCAAPQRLGVKLPGSRPPQAMLEDIAISPWQGVSEETGASSTARPIVDLAGPPRGVEQDETTSSWTRLRGCHQGSAISRSRTNRQRPPT